MRTFTVTQRTHWIVLLFVFSLTGCGFKLKGYSADSISITDVSTAMKVAVYHAERTSSGLNELQSLLKEQLGQSGGEEQIIDADRIIRLISEDVARRTLVRNDAGRAFEYQLELTVSAEFIEGEMIRKRQSSDDKALTGSHLNLNDELIQKSFKSYREYRYDNRQVLAAHNYEQSLLLGMRQEIADHILRYAFKPSSELAD